MYKLHNIDNMQFETDRKYDLVYADMIYENENCEWIFHYWDMLKDSGVFITQTDWHTNWLIRWYFETNTILKNSAVFVNHCVQKNEWGNHPKNKFHQCYDDIIIYAKGNNWKFYSDRVQVDKVTKNKGLNPSGRETKQATAWIDDICLTTTAKERVKKPDGHLIKWQKPLKLFDRIIAPFTDKGDWIVEPFGGTFAATRWAIQNNRNAEGIEYSKEVFEIGKEEVHKTSISCSNSPEFEGLK